jgi:hypothetical protein
MLSKYQVDIETAKRKIAHEKRQKLENWKFVVKMAEKEIVDYQNKIKREQVEKDKLISHENGIKRAAAQELYDKYLKASEQERQRFVLTKKKQHRD